MLPLIQAVFRWLAQRVLHLRYRVRVEGLERLRGLTGPTLVMPNHPAYIDPPLVLSHVRLDRPIRSVVTGRMYRNPALYLFMRLVQALEVPELEEHSRSAREQTLAMIDAVVAGLQRGENFLIYPSGRTQRGGVEVLGAARAAAEILERCPEANVVLVRTRGVWGSMFSWAQTGQSPNLRGCMLRGLGWILANLLLFTPRRNVTITIELLDRSVAGEAGRDKLNRWLEDWYNQGGLNPPVYVPYHFLFGPRTFQYPECGAVHLVDVEKIKPATIGAVNEMVEEHLGRALSGEEKQSQTALDQIGLDSLERMDIALKIEDRFGFRSNRVADTLGELWALAEGLAASRSGTTLAAPAAWNRPCHRTGSADALAETLAEAFVRRALLHPEDVAVSDRVSGVLTYRQLLIGASLLGKRLGRLPGRAIGVMLPASVAADVVFFALHLAGKLPVMLNWTTGPANLAHAVEKLEIRSVVTARRLIDRLGIEVEGADYVFMEEVRGQIGKVDAVITLLTSYLFPGSFLKGLPQPGLDDPAVVLFTSGSESTPKAVPLSHRNLIANVRGSVAVLQATAADSLLALLPPFHSFGLTGNVVVPILGGIRTVCHPDPTDAAGLVETVAQYRTTMLFTTPTFLGYMFSVATEDDLRSLRVLVTGAEKCPEALFLRGRQLAPNATILEGYGITECSPVVSGNRLDRVRPGTVGLPLDGVEVCVVDPESKELLPASTTGMLLVRGPSVFQGYLNYEGPDPFVEVAGKRWYNTGDLVQVDDEGFIHFRGRLKRFLKAGGEMISLPALEEPFTQVYPPTEQGPQVAVEGMETPSGRCIVLFSTQETSLRQANAILAEAGFRGVMRLDDVVRIDAIPVLGTGKTDYKVLRKMVAERVKPPN